MKKAEQNKMVSTEEQMQAKVHSNLISSSAGYEFNQMLNCVYCFTYDNYLPEHMY